MGRRLIVLAVLAAAGLVGGSATTVVHQSVWRIGSAVVPWGVVIALVAVACYLVGVRLTFAHRLETVVAAVAVLVAIGVLALPSAGGSTLVPANALGQAWVLGALVVAAVSVALPRVASSRGGPGHDPA